MGMFSIAQAGAASRGAIRPHVMEAGSAAAGLRKAPYVAPPQRRISGPPHPLNPDNGSITELPADG